VPVRLATLFLALSALGAASAALAGHVPALAALIVVSALASLVTVGARRPGPVLLSVSATVAASVLWAVVEARSHHVLNVAVTTASVVAALLLARPDARAYIAGAVEPHGVGQTSTEGS
jgi:hypothetical protein